jgi:hypothetical protein
MCELTLLMSPVRFFMKLVRAEELLKHSKNVR